VGDRGQNKRNREDLIGKILGGRGTPFTYEICLVIAFGFVSPCSLETIIAAKRRKPNQYPAMLEEGYTDASWVP
jgi:hypothetical protein